MALPCVRQNILAYLQTQPVKRIFYALNAATGQDLGLVPVLYTYGNNDIPAQPVFWDDSLYLPCRSRHGIQTDGGSVHVSTRYDAELGRMPLAGREAGSLDISGLRSSEPLAGMAQFRLTSDEPAVLTIGGGILWVDNWERLGGIDLEDGRLLPYVSG